MKGTSVSSFIETNFMVFELFDKYNMRVIWDLSNYLNSIVIPV